MIIGVPKEVKDQERRVGLIPSGVTALVEAGHQVLVQESAGEGSSHSLTLSMLLVAGAEDCDRGIRCLEPIRLDRERSRSRRRRNMRTSGRASISSPICISRLCPSSPTN